MLWWWLLSFEPRIRKRERTSFFSTRLLSVLDFISIASRGFFFYSFSSFAYRLLLFHSNLMVLLVSHEFSMVHLVFWLWLLIHSLVQYFIALYNTQHAYKLWKGDSYCIFFLFISSSRRHRRRLRYLFVHDFFRIICVYICCFFALFFFFLFFVLFLILFWLFSQRSYPSMLRPLCYLMNMVLVTVLRHDSMKQRAKCPNWCLWKRVILFLLACMQFVFSLYARAQVSFVFGVLLFAYDRFKMHFSIRCAKCSF